jgi:hypothetical protein
MPNPPSPTACVVIPCYTAALQPYERLAFTRCLDILKAHDIVIIKPQSLDLSELLSVYPPLRTESFDDDYFTGIGGYNRLMLSDLFYERFARYEYVLIHQLDAFVFSDQLLAWCARGYDYIGAPWFPNSTVPSWRNYFRIYARRTLYRWLNRADRHLPGIHHAQYMYSVGNGGFSLRRVAAMREALKTLHSRAEEYRRADGGFHNEDIFYCIEANRYVNHVKVPGIREASAFAWEHQPTVAAKLCDGKLPFGCHGFNKLHRDEWRPIFSRFGYFLDELLKQS